MKKTYYLHFGRETHLALLEWTRLFPQSTCTLVDEHIGMVMLDKDPEDLQKINNHLGGIRKISQEIGTLHNLYSDTIIDLIEPLCETGGKNTIGFSAYINKNISLKALLLTLKKQLKSTYSLRIVFPNSGNELNAAEIIHNNLVGKERHAEYNIIQQENAFVMTKTVAVNDIEAFTERDMGRPVRRLKAGLMSPKLASMMVNFSGAWQGVCYDPYCGDGGILQEALLKGFAVIGSDIDESAVTSTKRNLDWTREQYHTKSSIQVFQQDALSMKRLHCDIIVTEGSLGPGRFNKLSSKDAVSFFEHEKNLYTASFKQFVHNTDAEIVVFCFPAFRLQDNTIQFVPAEILNAITEQGWKFRAHSLSARQRTYIREDQIVGRTVTIWERSMST